MNDEKLVVVVATFLATSGLTALTFWLLGTDFERSGRTAVALIFSIAVGVFCALLADRN